MNAIYHSLSLSPVSCRAPSQQPVPESRPWLHRDEQKTLTTTQVNSTISPGRTRLRVTSPTFFTFLVYLSCSLTCSYLVLIVSYSVRVALPRYPQPMKPFPIFLSLRCTLFYPFLSPCHLVFLLYRVNVFASVSTLCSVSVKSLWSSYFA